MVAESRNCQILLVDPDRASREIIQSVLRETGAVVYAVDNAEQALDAFASCSIDIVITEGNLGDTQGLTALELKTRLALVDHSVQVIFLTSEHDLALELRAISEGVFAYLRKPIAHAKLLQHVATQAYNYSQLQRQNQNLQLQLNYSSEQLKASEQSLREVKKKFRRLAATDSLTNLYNRRFIEQMLKQEVDRRNRYKTALSLVFIDVDGFTEMCRDFGHETANFVLKDIARLLLQCSRTSDIVGRFAADVFVVLLPETVPENALVFAERARALIANHRFEHSAQQAAQVTVCIGVSGVEVTSRNITDKQLTVAAGKALHNAKPKGPNKIAVYPKLQPAQLAPVQTEGAGQRRTANTGDKAA